MKIFLSVLGIIMVILFIANLIYSQNFNGEVKSLFANSIIISDHKFSYDRLEKLPDPVQSYFRHILKENLPYISYVRLKHDGQFKTKIDKNWANIKGEQYFTAATPGFIWKGKIGIIKARDMYLKDKGRLVITLLNLINIADGHGENFDQGELLRWLAESVWFPTNLLPSDRLKWLPIDDNTAKLIYNYKGLSLFYIITFNEKNEIIQLETERYYGIKGLKTWVGNCSNYREMNGIKIPTIMKASWRLENGDYNYVIFHLNDIEYDIPKKF